MSHSLARDGLDEFHGIKSCLQHIRCAEKQRRHQCGKRPVEHEGARVHYDTLGCHAPSQREQRAVIRADVMRVHDALWLARGATAVDDVEQIVIAYLFGDWSVATL